MAGRYQKRWPDGSSDPPSDTPAPPPYQWSTGQPGYRAEPVYPHEIQADPSQQNAPTQPSYTSQAAAPQQPINAQPIPLTSVYVENAPASGAEVNIRPENYKGLAWFALCCCWYFGRKAVAASREVDVLYSNGDYQGALAKSGKAKQYSINAIIIGSIACVIVGVSGYFYLKSRFDFDT